MPRNLRGRFDSIVQQARHSVTVTSHDVANRVGQVVLQKVGDHPEIFERIRVAQSQLIGAKSDLAQRGAAVLSAADLRLEGLNIPPAAQGAVSAVRSTIDGVRARLQN